MRKYLLLLLPLLLLFVPVKGRAQTNIQSGPTNPTHCNPGSSFYNTTSLTYLVCGPVTPNTWTSAGGTPVTTVSGLSAYAVKGAVVGVTDGTSSSDCTVGGGTTTVVCQYNGSAWVVASGSSAFSAITSATNSTAAMVVGSGASLATSGTGTIQATNVTNGSGAPSNPCANGAVYTDNSTGNTYSCDALAWQVIGSASSSNPNLINPSLLGVKADGKIFYSTTSTINVSSGSNIVTCNNCSFTSVDIGKTFEAVTGGCCGATNMRAGTLSMGANLITGVTNSTTITTTNNATANCAANCIIGYGTNDDAAWTTVDNAIAASIGCSVIVVPAGYSFIKEPHFNISGPMVCNDSSTGHDYDYRFLGSGPYVSNLVIQNNFDWTACVFGPFSNGCFFSLRQVQVDNLGMTGMSFGATGSNSKVLLTPFFGSQFSDDSFIGFGGSDTASTGIYFTDGLRAKFLNMDAFGGTGGASRFFGTAAINYCYWCFFGDNLGHNFFVSDGEFIDYGSEYSQSGTFANLYQSGATYIGFGSSSFQGGHTVTGAAYYNQGGTAYLIGGNWDNSATTNGNGIVIQGGTVYARDTVFKGNGTGGGVKWASGTYFDQGGNQYQTASIAIAPACTFSTGGGTTPSCATQAGSTNEKGVIIATTGTGAPGSTGTITLTFVGTFSGASGAAPACTYTLDNSGTAWGAEAVTQINTQSTTAPVINWTNIAALTATALATSSPYRIDYTCQAR